MIKRRPKKRRTPNPLKAGQTGKSAVTKGPLRDPDHLARIRTLPCIVSGTLGVDAHHVRIGLRTMGVRKSDARAVPLSRIKHNELHSMKEDAFWEMHGIRPLEIAFKLYAETLRLRITNGVTVGSPKDRAPQ